LLACFLAILLGVFLVFTLRIQVPMRFAVDGPLFSPVQLVTLDAQSAPALQTLLERGKVPTLGNEDLLLESPFVDDFLTRFNLEEVPSRDLALYPAPSAEEELTWPNVFVGESGGLTLPAVTEVELSRPELPIEPEGWFLMLKAPAGWRDVLPDFRLPWQGELPLELASEMTVVLAPDGGTALSFLSRRMEPKIERKLRATMERWISQIELEKLPPDAEPVLSVQVSFFQSRSSLP
jgi:hypothetical protein